MCNINTFLNLALHHNRGIILQMAKLDPIVSEFESDEAAEAYDVWFRAQVEAALAETGPGIPHEQVMAEARAIIEKHKNAQSDLAA